MRPRRSVLLVATAVLALSMLRAGSAPATVAEQRARLPPPAECTDAVTGVWRAHVYYDHVQQWYIFTLRIGRSDAGSEALIGQIESTWWNGGPDQQEAPHCGPGVHRGAVLEQALGTHRDGRLRFDAMSWKASEGYCDQPPQAYLLDRFTGVVDSARQEFQSVLNADAPEWRDVPTVFRRIRCEDQPETDRPDSPVGLRRPALLPSRGSGCDCSMR